MRLTIKTPKQSLNKAFLKQRPLRSEIDLFKDNLTKLLGNIDEIEREENQKTHIRDFLRDTYYKESNEINTKDSKDLVIHNGKTNKDNVGVIIEAKRPSNKPEMLTADKPNVKAFQELVLYYLRERVEEKNNDIKYLVATNIYEWYIFEASYFEKAFFKNKAFVKQYEDWRDGKKVTKETSLFYNEIAKPFINALEDEIPCTHFDIRTYETALKNADKEDDKKLIQLFKILSPNHLLKVSFADDSNTLDEKFYKELLHIIGLEEAKDGSKFIIRRKLEDKRNAGSLLEMAISILETEDPLHKVTDIQNYGETKEEKIYNVALELCITWINRILFLKLLEGQLVNYHKGDKAYRFLNSDMIKDFDELYKLFHQVLAKTTEERPKVIKEKYDRVPYLNSSLFEISDLEDQTLKINQLDNSALLELINSSILKEDKKKAEALPSLEYVFRFLDAYDFASEGKEDIQEDSKKLINASVLGKVFEKINGYKDGSIFTPGFITMYMCRQSIRLAVLQKFKDKYDWKADTFDDLKNYLADKKSSKDTLINNRLINSLHICDPAVGSGHFLVSALNEIIAIKSELGLLADEKGVRISDYKAEVINDELVVYNTETGEGFEYVAPAIFNKNISYSFGGDRFPIKTSTPKEIQRLQRTLFHEKQTIIENCLFGVDINPNSVKICRLRLWIELLKNAYYKQPDSTELETLPNIDINIKCGNSLLSRFPLDIDLTEAFKKQQFNLDTYKTAVEAYRKTSDKKAKSELTALIKQIKEEYTATIYKRDPRRKKLAEIRGQIALVQNNVDLFGTKKLSDKDKAVEERRLTLLLEQREKELQEAEQGVMYRNAFEWRFEFPEVLDKDGKYEGFDLIIANPPYIRQEEFKELKSYLKSNFETYTGTSDLYVFFAELGFSILKEKGQFSYIMPNKWMQAGYGKPVRSFLRAQKIHSIIDFGDLQIFDEATTYPCIINAEKNEAGKSFDSVLIKTLTFSHGFEEYVNSIRNTILISELSDETWIITSGKEQKLLNRIKSISVSLSEYVNGEAYYGIKTGLTEAFLIDEETKDRLIKEDKKSKELIAPFLLGRDIQPYLTPEVRNYVILIPKGFTIKKNLPKSNPYHVDEPTPRYGNMEYNDASYWLTDNYPAIAKHLLPFRKKAEARTDQGDYWWELRACDYYPKFLGPKIMYQKFQVKPCFIFDKEEYYCNDSMWIIPTNDKTLLGILNSTMGWWLISKYCTAIQNGYQLIWKYFGEIPIPKVVSKEQSKAVIAIVNKIISAKEKGADTEVLESEIDKIIYSIYNLTPSEIKIIEQR